MFVEDKVAEDIGFDNRDAKGQEVFEDIGTRGEMFFDKCIAREISHKLVLERWVSAETSIDISMEFAV